MNISNPHTLSARLVKLVSSSCLLIAGLCAPAHAQFKLQETFENTTAPGWTLSSSAILTAPSIDPAGSGWLRLTAAVGTEKGEALNDAFSFTSSQSVVVEFDYVSWGGTGADGMTVFLYDPTTANPMSGALTGGGLGYCGGAGGYLAIGLDEYGNFSNPGDKCAGDGGPGFKPESLVIRGPESASDEWVTTTSVPGGIDNPHVATRPSPKRVLLVLTPAVPPSIGYTITAQFQSSSTQPFQTLFSNVAFPYLPPATLAVGFSGSTGGSTNTHELQGLVAATPDDLQVTMNGPSTALQGASVTYNVTLTNNGSHAIDAADAPTVVDSIPAAVTGATWSCVGAGGATCDASGTGSINTSDVTLPSNGSVTYTITGTIDPAAICGSTVANTASADFGSSSSFLDPDETNNSATVDATVICNVTLVANPTSLTYGPQTVNVASTSQTVTVSEGTNSSTIDSIVASGDYSQTNDCPTALSASQTCTINVIFTPTAEGTRTGTLTIVSNATSSPQVTTPVGLTGTGTNAAPSPFSFTPLTNVTPSSVQISNAITISNTNVPSPISVSSGAQYSVNGGPFTSVPGIVSPGSQVVVQVTAASSSNTAVSAVLTVGGVGATFTVTTGAQAALQGSFTPLTGVAPSSVQISNPVTVTGTLPATITAGSGTLYSINGGQFTSAAGSVTPGEQVTVEITSPANYNTTASGAVTIGGVNSTFTVTTAAQPMLQGGFAAVSSAPPSSSQISNPITVTGTTPEQISISGAGEYSVDGGPFTSAQGVVAPGDQVRVRVTSSSTYSTSTSVVLTIGAVETTFSVTTGAQLQNVVVTAGGGGMDLATVLILALLALVRIIGVRRAALVVPLSVAVLGAIFSSPARAQDGGGWLENLYGGVRIGGDSSSITPSRLTAGLQADGYDVTAADGTRSAFGGTLYAGYELPRNFAAELGWSYLGRTRAELEGVEPPSLTRLLAAAAHIARGAGDVVSLEARYRWDLAPRIAIDFRAGPYLWITKTDISINGGEALSRTDEGAGYTLGLGPRYNLGDHLGFGVSADYFASTSQNHFWRLSATAEYRF